MKPRIIRIEGDVAYVTLTRGYVATIDAADAPLVAGFNWYALVAKGGHVYAVRTLRGRRRGAELMHRAIISAPPHLDVDHVDNDGLNNRRKNLRLCTVSQNLANRGAEARNTTGAKGVYRDGSRYRACIQQHGRTIHLGSFDTVELAAAAYAGAAKALFGKFARAA